MSELNYIRTKNCTCCSVRLDRTTRRDIRRVNQNNVELFNTVKPIILSNKRKTIDNNVVNVGDYVCGGCINFSKRFKPDQANPIETLRAQLYPTLPDINEDPHEFPVSTNTVPSQPSLFAATTSTASSSNVDIDDDQIDQVTLKIPRTINSSKNCFICHYAKVPAIMTAVTLLLIVIIQ